MSETASDELKQVPLALPRRRFFDDMPDKGVFVLAATAGFAMIFLMKLWDYNPHHVAAMAVIFMLIYGIAVMRIPAVTMRPDRLGDNFYYLGFIYTLASLSSALSRLSGGADLSNEVLGSFGIALVTTIVGIAGRVVFVQFRGNLDDIEERSRVELAAAASELRAHLSASVREFEVFHTALLQTLRETAEASARANQNHIQEFVAFAGSTKREMEQIAASNRSQVDSMGQAVATLNEAVRDLATKTESVKLPSDEISAEMVRFSKGLEKVLDRLSGIVEETAQRIRIRSRRWWWPFSRGRRNP